MQRFSTQILLVVLLVIANSIFSQNREMSSYKAMPVNPHIDSARYYEKNNPTLAFEFVTKALELAISGNNEEEEGECYIIIGNINYNVQQYDFASENYLKALTIFTKLKNTKKEFEINNLLARTYEASNNLEASESYYQNIAVQAKKEQNSRKLKLSKRNLANVYSKQGEQDKAIKELEEVRKMDIEEGDTEEQFLTNQQLIDVFSKEQPQRALELVDENEALAINIKDTLAIINTLQKKVEVYDNLGKEEEKLNTLQKSLEVRKQQNDISGQSADVLKISEVLLEQEKVDDAITYLKKSIELSEIAGYEAVETRKSALKQLSGAYDKTGNYNAALRSYKQYVEAAEESARQREEKILENLELMQSLSKRLQRIDMLENQKALNDKTILLLEKEQRIASRSLKQLRIIIGSLLVGIFLLSIGLYLFYKSSKQKRVANQLLALRSLRSQMNPHFIFNALNSVNSYISKSDERSANKYLSDFSKLMRAVLENSKHDFVNLASEIEIIELYIKLEHHRFKEKFDYTFTIDEDIDRENIKIPPMLIQPYIENAVWHGLRYKEEKGYLNVRISNGKVLTAVVEDNGIGRRKSLEMKTKNQREVKSTGLKNINNRLKIINEVHKTNLQVNVADLNKETQSGTKVTIQILQK